MACSGSGVGTVEAEEPFGGERKLRSQGKKGRGYAHKTGVSDRETLMNQGNKAQLVKTEGHCPALSDGFANVGRCPTHGMTRSNDVALCGTISN